MWKALIKVVEKWAYRCEHDWKKIKKIDVMDPRYKYPIETNVTYACKKCYESKKIKL